MSALAPSSYAWNFVTLALAWFFVINVLTCAAVSIVAERWLQRRTDVAPAVWFALRLLPAASALAFVVALFLPSFWKYEPRDIAEAFDITLTVCAVGALVLIGAAIYRGAFAWRSATRRTRAWMQHARPLSLPGTGIPAFQIDADTAVMALAGVLRPRLLVTRALVEALTPEELAASVAHEMGHSRAKDNLKRLLMRSAPDLFGSTKCARAIETRWAAAAEHRADRMVSDQQPATRCALASALVKVARLTPPAPSIAEPISTLIGGGDVAARVRSLLDDAAPAGPLRGIPWAIVGTTATALVVAYAPLLYAVHHATEALVQFLP